MKTHQKSLSALLAACTFVSLALGAGNVQAQQNRTPRIEGFSVDEVQRLDPGVELNFLMYGTPGGTATLRINGAKRNVALTETNAGQYEGVYTISRSDKIAARSAVTANLRVGNQVTSAVLNESLQIGVGPHNNNNARTNGGDNSRATGPAPRIESFNVRPSGNLSAGNELEFTVNGTPDAKVDLAIAGARAKFFLQEVRRGEYSGEYVIRNGDRIAPNSVVTANMTVDGRVTSAVLGRPLMTASAPVARIADAPVRVCQNCGTIEAINVVEVKGEGGYLGTIGGGVLGALAGSQVGGGNGKTAAEIAGALGGAYVGRAIEGRSKQGNHYEVVIRLQNGASQTVTYPNEPGYRVGERVTVTNGVLARMP